MEERRQADTRLESDYTSLASWQIFPESEAVPKRRREWRSGVTATGGFDAHDANAVDGQVSSNLWSTRQWTPNKRNY